MPSTLMTDRRAGVLLHITSLPGPHAFGDFSEYAYQFIDQLCSAGLSVWQILPLGPTHEDMCPYQSLSAHAGNPQLINLEWLANKGWLTSDNIQIKNGTDLAWRIELIEHAYSEFERLKSPANAHNFQLFIEQNYHWLHDYALFIVLRNKFDNKSWTEWPAQYRDVDKDAIDEFKFHHKEKINAIFFQQYIFFTQWSELKAYANQRGVFIIGDMPIFVAHDSAEVWAKRQYFAVNEHGVADFVAGVPPDYFSEFGQRWGNPHYQWDQLEADEFSWWVQRMNTQNKLYDGVRIDHFRGLAQYWEIPASEENAVNGRWVDAPGEKLLRKLNDAFPDLALIAEDLGTITQDVIQLREQFALPGMLILQFAFSGDDDNPYLPCNHAENSLVYTATHDNDTTVSWYASLSPETKSYISHCLGKESIDMPWTLIEIAFESRARLAIIPMQDLLGLGYGFRMNTPGTTEGNWRWRLEEEQFNDEIISRVESLLMKFERFSYCVDYDSSHVMQPNSNL